jgi:hypothetical protein
MAGHAGTGAVRELLVVLALAVAGLFLAVIAAFAPWYGPPAQADRPVVVELHAPAGPPAATGLTTAEGGG